MKSLIIVTGESSGELYGSFLAKEMKKRYPDVHIIGIGGEKMKKAGVELISGISSAFGISELFSSLKDINLAFKKIKKAIKELMPYVIVLIDFPDFNIKVAEFAKTKNVKILYYVSPQVWAWRKNRVKKIASLVDRMAVILPFEEEIYKKAGVRCEFVGHPIIDEIEEVLQSAVNTHPSLLKPSDHSSKSLLANLNTDIRTYFKKVLGFDLNRPLLSLLPGSRHHELERHLPLMIDVIRSLKNDLDNNLCKDFQFCIPLAPNINETKYRRCLDTLVEQGAFIKKGETIQALIASDIAVVASGTATLQAAFLEVPTIVIYKLSPVSYLFGKMLIDLKYISLVNILCGKEAVPEFIQKKANAGNIIKEIKRIRSVSGFKEEMIKQFKKIKEIFLGHSASKRVCEIIGEMSGWEH